MFQIQWLPGHLRRCHLAPHRDWRASSTLWQRSQPCSLEQLGTTSAISAYWFYCYPSLLYWIVWLVPDDKNHNPAILSDNFEGHLTGIFFHTDPSIPSFSLASIFWWFYSFSQFPEFSIFLFSIKNKIGFFMIWLPACTSWELIKYLKQYSM